jgi:metal-dependent amidase/aminoacylase/carboxypeptidase family protein
VDPIVIAARIVLALQTIVARENNPLDPAVVTVGSIHGGTKNNIIPEQVKMQLTVRAFKPEVMARLIGGIERIARGEAAAAGAPREPLVTVDDSVPPEYNDPALTARVVGALREALGADNVVEAPAEMGAEDFAAYGLAGVPSLLLHVGAVDQGKFAAAQRSGTPLPSIHSPQFAPAYEPTIKTATMTETAALFELLGR